MSRRTASTAPVRNQPASQGAKPVKAKPGAAQEANSRRQRFEQAAKEVFSKYDETLRKLAQ
jgi:hypothetical protein